MEKNEFVSFYRCSWLFYVYILRHFFNQWITCEYYRCCVTIGYNSFSALFLKEEIRLNYWIGIILGAIGVLFITIPSKSANQEVSLIGDILILLSTFLFAFYTVLLKRPKQEQYLSNEVFTTLTLIIGAVILLPFALVEIFYYGLPKVETWKTVLSVIYLVIGATILAYWFWNKALERVSASVSGLYLNALPLISIITSIILLNESLTWRVIMGASLVLIGVGWADKQKLCNLLKGNKVENRDC